MTENEARPTAGGPVHRRYCGECGTRIDQLCPKCYPAAQPAPPASLREAVEEAVNDICSYGIMRDALHRDTKDATVESVIDIIALDAAKAIDAILAAVAPVEKEYRDMIRRFVTYLERPENPYPLSNHADDCDCVDCSLLAEARRLMGGKDE